VHIYESKLSATRERHCEGAFNDVGRFILCQVKVDAIRNGLCSIFGTNRITEVASAAIEGPRNAPSAITPRYHFYVDDRLFPITPH
jgi:hypothetical protein